MENYKHKGKSLTGTVAYDLILEIFDGQTDVTTKDITNKVKELHLSREGLPQTSHTSFPVTDGLDRLKQDNKATNEKQHGARRGFWRIDSAGIEADISDMDKCKEGILTIGEGKSSVYLYYFLTFRLYAESQGKDSYPCKIGRTDGSDPISYINNQAGTSLPEKPEIGLIIQTDNPVGVEKGIHGLLDDDGLRKKDAPGQEWFVTNPDKVKRYYEHAINIR